MSRIYDYGSFSNNKSSFSDTRNKFGSSISLIDIDITGKPKEFIDINDVKVFLEYSTSIRSNKRGLEGVDFMIDSIELVMKVETANGNEDEIDFDLIPGKTIDYGQVKYTVNDFPIPSYPENIEINMNGFTDPSKFDVMVYFGTNHA
jgi:hypothetical protein